MNSSFLILLTNLSSPLVLDPLVSVVIHLDVLLPLHILFEVIILNLAVQLSHILFILNLFVIEFP